MRLSISGETKIDLKGLFGPAKITIKAISGDFHITEIPFNQINNYSVRTSENTITSLSVESQTSFRLVLKMLNADAARLRVRERVTIKNVSDEITGFIDLDNIVDATGDDELTHKLVTFKFNDDEVKVGGDGTYLLPNVLSTHYIVLYEDTILELGDETEPLDTLKFQSIFVNGTGVIELSQVKKKA